MRWEQGGWSVAATAFTARLTDEIVDVFDPATFVSSTANASGRISPTRAAHVLEDLDGKIDLIVDGKKAGSYSSEYELAPNELVRAPDGTPIALGYHTGHWEVGLLVQAAAREFNIGTTLAAATERPDVERVIPPTW